MTIVNRIQGLILAAASIFRAGPWWPVGMSMGRLAGCLMGNGVGNALLDNFRTSSLLWS